MVRESAATDWRTVSIRSAAAPEGTQEEVEACARSFNFPGRHHFHCCQPQSQLCSAQVALLLPLLLALAGIFGWTSLRTGRVQATLLHLGALLLLAGTSLFLGAACFAWSRLCSASR
uniref:Transmembrane protein 100 n=1 Tax=Macrostomum lignano TaxID=282301 RepID=A0A1I8FNQ6_9PLAT